MINIKELLDDLMASGVSREDALIQVKKSFKKRNSKFKKEAKKYAVKRESFWEDRKGL